MRTAVRKQHTVIVGVDCATEAKNVGLACGVVDCNGRTAIKSAAAGLTRDRIVRQVAEWVREAPASLLALDAPLGWPSPLAEALASHAAGQPLGRLPDALFLRSTDHDVRRRLGKRPLEVGADRIARTAAAALELLSDIRSTTGLSFPLAWSPTHEARGAAIEVYPAATILSHRIVIPRYKGSEPAHLKGRRQLVEELAQLADLGPWAITMEASDDALDAVACVVAGADFLRGESVPPTDPERASQEGWIWCRSLEAI